MINIVSVLVPLILVISLMVIIIIYLRVNPIEVECKECEDYSQSFIYKCKENTGIDTITCDKYIKVEEEIEKIQDRIININNEFDKIRIEVTSKTTQIKNTIDQEFNKLKITLNEIFTKLNFFGEIKKILEQLPILKIDIKIPGIDFQKLRELGINTPCDLININKSLDVIEKLLKIPIPRLLTEKQTDICGLLQEIIRPLLIQIVNELQKNISTMFSQIIDGLKNNLIIPISNELTKTLDASFAPFQDIKNRYTDLKTNVEIFKTDYYNNNDFLDLAKTNLINKTKDFIGFNQIIFWTTIILGIIILGGLIGILSFIYQFVNIPVDIVSSFF